MDIIEALRESQRQLGRPWSLSGDWMIAGDVHAPLSDFSMCERLGQVARRELPEPRRLLLAGDFLDMSSFSGYDQVVTPPSWALEREAARAILKMWMETFQEIRLLMGNHERRLQRFTAGAFETADILSLIINNPERVMLSNYGWCTVESAGETYRVTHPNNYSAIQLSVLEQLALKYDQNIIGFHEHHLSKGWDRYKRRVIACGGCLQDASRTAYKALDDSKHAGWAVGFVSLIGGVVELYGQAPYTDWSKYDDGHHRAAEPPGG